MSATTPSPVPTSSPALPAWKATPSTAVAWFGVIGLVATAVVILAAAAAVLV